MLSRFERFISPTAAPEHPEPPHSLLAFLWHFARQAKWLFAALFVVELLVALSDSAVPWFIGRVVTLVTKTPPERLLADGLPWFLGMAVVVIVVRPAVDDISTGGQRYLPQTDGSFLAQGYAPTKHRVKLTVSILDRDLRADALRVAASRQVLENGQWVAAPVTAATVQRLEEIILTRARDLRRNAVAG